MLPLSAFCGLHDVARYDESMAPIPPCTECTTRAGPVATVAGHANDCAMTNFSSSYQTDVAIVGCGVAGLSAAIVAKTLGLEVLIIEKSRYVGGTSAVSGGAVWIPNNPHTAATGVEDSVEKAALFLESVIGNRVSRTLKDAFLRHGPAAVSYLEAHSDLRLAARAYAPDYLSELPGASLGGRIMDPLPFDGRDLGAAFEHLRPPIPEFGVFGRMMVNRADIEALLSAHKSPRAAMHGLRLFARYWSDRRRGYSRGTRLLMGNALVARLYKTVLRLCIPVWREATAQRLNAVARRITGLDVAHNGAVVRVDARRGVILSSGGFPYASELRRRLLPESPELLSAGIADNTGDGIAIAEAAGATIATGNANNAFWSPVSLSKRADGSVARFPHLMFDRAKPGLIAVNIDGRRFVNEADSYHEFVKAMLGRGGGGTSVPAFLICDSNFVAKYPFGLVPPGWLARRRYLRSGYLKRATSILELARVLGVNATNLAATIDRFNASARLGQDPEFGRGRSAYNRYLGDAAHKPNPCVAPLDRAPFYAIEVLPGDIGTACGLTINEDARVMAADGEPIEGLYACGNDANSVMGGEYPGPGITLGPAIAFAYAAARHIAQQT
jgi:succinate dehydrogenase/fumarate reductase flavoprotein subunit